MAQRLWTSDQRFSGPGVPAKHQREFCSLLNAALRRDDGKLLAEAMPLIRVINKLCVVRGERPEALLRIPPGNRSFRGAGIPDAHLGFYVPGVKYRVPGYLATSFKREARHARWARAGARLPSLDCLATVWPHGLTCRFLFRLAVVWFNIAALSCH